MIKDRSELKARPIEIDLNGPEGNAFMLIGKAIRFAKQLDLDSDKIVNEMKSGDYENLINVFEKYFGDYVIMYR